MFAGSSRSIPTLSKSLLNLGVQGPPQTSDLSFLLVARWWPLASPLDDASRQAPAVLDEVMAEATAWAVEYADTPHEHDGTVGHGHLRTCHRGHRETPSSREGSAWWREACPDSAPGNHWQSPGQ